MVGGGIKLDVGRGVLCFWVVHRCHMVMDCRSPIDSNDSTPGPIRARLRQWFNACLPRQGLREHSNGEGEGWVLSVLATCLQKSSGTTKAHI